METQQEQLKQDYNLLMGLGMDDSEIMMVAKSFSKNEPEHALSIKFNKTTENDYVETLKCAVEISTILLNQNKK